MAPASALKHPNSNEHELEARVAERERVVQRRAEAFDRITSAHAPELDLNLIHARAVLARIDALHARLTAVEQVEMGLNSAARRYSRWPGDLPRPVESAPSATQVVALPSATEVRDRFREDPRRELISSAVLESDGARTRGVVLNVSPRGAFIATSTSLKAGTKVTVNMVLGSDQRVSGRSVVRWVRPWNQRNPHVLPGVGIELAPTESGALEILANFVRNSAADFPTP